VTASQTILVLVVLGLFAATILSGRPAHRPDAVAWIRVRDPGMGGAAGEGAGQPDRESILNLVTSADVLRAALRMPGVAEGTLLRQQADPIAWLTRHVAVQSRPDSEVATVRIPDQGSDDAALVVNAVVEALIAHIDSGRMAEVEARRIRLTQQLDETDAELKRSVELFANTRPGSSPAEADEIPLDSAALVEEIERLRRLADQICRQMEAVALEATAPPRVQLLDAARTSP